MELRDFTLFNNIRIGHGTEYLSAFPEIAAAGE
jgi:hypothetical protein